MAKAEKPFKLGPIQKAWVRALRNGKYKQGDTYLSQKVRKITKHCCLGVLCQMAVKEDVIKISDESGVFLYELSTSVLPNKVEKWAGVRDECGGYQGSALTTENDKGVSFTEIATIIEEHASEIFTRSA